MLSRIIATQFKYAYATTVPQVVKQQKKTIGQLSNLRTEQITPNFGSNSINFEQQIDGKNLILQTGISSRTSLNLTQLGVAASSLGLSWSLISNFNYLLTLGFLLGGVGSILAGGSKIATKSFNSINSIQIDKNQRLHINYMKAQLKGYDTIIVDKKDFQYNVFGARNANAIWCKVNGQDFWINRQGLQINNQQFHNLV